MEGSDRFADRERDLAPDQVVVNAAREHVLADIEQANRRIEALEEQLLEARGQVAQTRSNNEKLTITIQQTRDQIAALRDEVEKLTQPPAVYGTFVDFNEDGTVDIFASGRKMRVALHPDSTRPRSRAATRWSSTSPSRSSACARPTARARSSR